LKISDNIKKMTKTIVFLVLVILIISFTKEGLAGGTQTEGQGTRPISMGGAFIAVADGPEAVFYNPAGLTQIKGTAVELGALSVNPKNKYTHGSNGVVNESDQPVVAPYTFFSCDMANPLYFGFGMYAPFAREADYDADTVGNFGNLYALSVRTDYSSVVAYKINEQLSVGAGFIAAQGKTKQTIQTAYGNGVYITDESDGWGYSGLVGLLYKVKEWLKIGGVYRGRMDIILEGEREQTGWSAPRNTTTNLHYPATAGIGIACTPSKKWTLALDVDWNDWSYFYEAVTRIEGAADSTTCVDSHDTVDCRVGLEFKPDETTALRCGFMYIPSATPSEWILPQKPDYDKSYAITFGASKNWKDLELGLLYEYVWSNKWDVADNAYGYNGRYEVRVHTFGLDISYKF
jgi:long-chain fatty acid transport protein